MKRGLTALDRTQQKSDQVAAPISFQHGQGRENPSEEVME
jgi:hypothetical protein